MGIIGQQQPGQEHAVENPQSRSQNHDTARSNYTASIGSLLGSGHRGITRNSPDGRTYSSTAHPGYGHSEIRNKLDEIEDFAEVEQVLDTPVKRYSSGMSVRLTFAVAAHLKLRNTHRQRGPRCRSDATFPKKCLGKIGEVIRDGQNGFVCQP